MPMTFDQYSNCSFGCLYCFSTYRRAIGGPKEAYLNHEVSPVNVDSFKKIFTDPDSSQFGEYVKARKVMQWGGMSDPFCFFEKEFGVGLEILRFLREIDYPISISTKGIWWAKDERYMELFRDNPKWNVKVSIITLDKAKQPR